MAGQRQPTNLLLLKGKKHLTKAEIKERQESEVKAKADNVKPPSYLPEELKTEFEEIANELMRIEIISNLDVDALARFLLAREQYVRASMELRKMSPIEVLKDKKGNEVTAANETYGDVLLSVDKLFKQCRQAAADLGLTISSRCKLVIPKKAEEKPKSPDEEMFGESL